MSLVDVVVSRFAPLRRRLQQLNDMTRRLDDLQMAVGRIERHLSLSQTYASDQFQRHEFKVFSQWGEDGLIQYLIHALPVTVPVFVEFGVHDYKESNTRFLLQHDNWSGLVMDASQENIDTIMRDPVYFRHNLRAIHAFIDRENINDLLRQNGITGDIALLSIDIDGNDYWVWEAVDCVSPRIVICEYDSYLGPTGRWQHHTIPSSIAGRRTTLFCMAVHLSQHSITWPGRKHGGPGSNSAGNNAFFVRKDLQGNIPAMTPREAYRKAQFRHSSDANGRFTFLRFEEAQRLVADMPVIDVETNATITIRDLLFASTSGESSLLR